MKDPRNGPLAGPTGFTRFGLSRATLAAAIEAELEEAGDSQDPRVIASAVAAAIEANNQELLRQLSRLQSSDAVSATAPAESSPEEP